MVFRGHCRSRQVGDPVRRSRHLRTEQSRTLNGTSSRNCPLASPGGVAERSEFFKIMIASGNHSKIEKLLSVARLMRGWRQVGSGMQLDEWHMFWFSPLNGEI